MGGGINGCRYLPHIVNNSLVDFTLHCCCPSNRTEHKGGRALNGKQLIRDRPSVVTSS
jgi:hypothetical protein